MAAPIARPVDVVVGVDGGRCALTAVGVAAAEAAGRGAALKIVHADGWTVPPVYDLHALDRAPEDPGDVVAEAAGLAALRHPELTIRTEVAAGPSVVALLAASRGAALTVVGRRGLGGFADRQLGSTAGQIVMYGRSPVLVVRGAVRPRGPVLVAVDARHPAPPVLAFAFHEAHLRGVELHVLYGWSPADDEALPAGEWRAAAPETGAVKVVTQERYTPDLPRTLVRASASAGLVVVGSHRRDDLSGIVLGPAAFALAHQAQCPVAVVHPDDRATADRL